MLGTPPVIYLFDDFLTFSKELVQLRQNCTNNQPNKPLIKVATFTSDLGYQVTFLPLFWLEYVSVIPWRSLEPMPSPPTLTLSILMSSSLDRFHVKLSTFNFKFLICLTHQAEHFSFSIVDFRFDLRTAFESCCYNCIYDRAKLL